MHHQPGMETQRRYKFVVFDCDGVLIDGHVSLYVADRLGVGKKIRSIYKDVILGSKNFSQAVDDSLSLFIGLKESDVAPLLKDVPLMLGAEETINAIKREGLIVGTVSTGASQYFVDILKDRLGLDFALGTAVKIEDGTFTGIDHPVIDLENKDLYIIKIASDYGLDLQECVAVGDDVSNISLFKKLGLGIAFNVDCLKRELPGSDLSIKDRLTLSLRLSLAERRTKRQAHVTIQTKDLTAILPTLGIKREIIKGSSHPG